MFIPLQNAIDIANMPEQLRRAMIDEAYDSAFANHDPIGSSNAIALEAAVNLVSKIPGAVRHVVYDVPISTWETIKAEIVGKFIFIEW